MFNPSILVAVPTKNDISDIPNLVNSMKDQNCDKWNLLFIDASDIEKSENYLKNICHRDNRFKFIKENTKTKSIYNAMNLAFDYVHDNEWLFFWGSDDWASSNTIIETIYSQIELNNINNIDPDLIVYSAEYFDLNDKRIKRNTIFENSYRILNFDLFKKKLFFGHSLPHQATLFSPKVRLNKTKYDTKLKLASDLDYFLKISNKRDITIQTIPTSIITIGTNGVSSKLHILRTYEVIQCYFKYFKTLFFIPFIFRYLRRYFQLISMK